MTYEVASQILSTHNIASLVLYGGTCRFFHGQIPLCLHCFSPKMAGRGDAEVEKKVVDKEGNGGAVET